MMQKSIININVASMEMKMFVDAFLLMDLGRAHFDSGLRLERWTRIAVCHGFLTVTSAFKFMENLFSKLPPALHVHAQKRLNVM